MKNQWNKLVLYTAGEGWDERLCKQIPSVCELLRGKMRTEGGAERERYASGTTHTHTHTRARSSPLACDAAEEGARAALLWSALVCSGLL